MVLNGFNNGVSDPEYEVINTVKIGFNRPDKEPDKYNNYEYINNSLE